MKEKMKPTQLGRNTGIETPTKKAINVLLANGVRAKLYRGASLGQNVEADFRGNVSYATFAAAAKEHRLPWRYLVPNEGGGMKFVLPPGQPPAPGTDMLTAEISPKTGFITTVRFKHTHVIGSHGGNIIKLLKYLQMQK